MSTKVAALPWSENISQRRFSSGTFRRRLTACASFSTTFRTASRGGGPKTDTGTGRRRRCLR